MNMYLQIAENNLALTAGYSFGAFWSSMQMVNNLQAARAGTIAKMQKGGAFTVVGQVLSGWTNSASINALEAMASTLPLNAAFHGAMAFSSLLSAYRTSNEAVKNIKKADLCRMSEWCL